MNATVRDLGRKGCCRRARVHGYSGLAPTKEDRQGESGEGRAGKQYGYAEWKPNKSYKLGDRVTIRYKGQAFLLLCMEPGWSGLRPPAILRGGSKAPGHEYETAVVRVHDGTCVWKWKIV